MLPGAGGSESNPVVMRRSMSHGAESDEDDEDDKVPLGVIRKNLRKQKVWCLSVCIQCQKYPTYTWNVAKYGAHRKMCKLITIDYVNI